MDKLRVAVLGASGYSGAELVRLLAAHPRVQIAALGADSSAGKGLDELYGSFRGLALPKLEKLDAAALKGRADLAFLCLPHTESMAATPALLDAGLKVIDLSGDFRLSDTAAYERYYKKAHTAPGLIPEAVYGLSEINAAKLKGARLVANPGCYTTTAILALYPLLKAGLLKPQGIVIDAKSGVSGAGRKLAGENMFVEVEGNFSAYKVGGAHQHIPELEQWLSQAAGAAVTLSFTPHLLPLNRGIFVTAYGDLAKPALSDAQLQAALADFYKGRPFIRVLQGSALPSLRDVQGSNLCEMTARADQHSGKAVVLSVTDNLIKGAAGQAVQNMNLVCGWPETDGLGLQALPV